MDDNLFGCLPESTYPTFNISNSIYQPMISTQLNNYNMQQQPTNRQLPINIPAILRNKEDRDRYVSIVKKFGEPTTISACSKEDPFTIWFLKNLPQELIDSGFNEVLSREKYYPNSLDGSNNHYSGTVATCKYLSLCD